MLFFFFVICNIVVLHYLFLGHDSLLVTELVHHDISCHVIYTSSTTELLLIMGDHATTIAWKITNKALEHYRKKLDSNLNSKILEPID